jgi:hypothetical protein
MPPLISAGVIVLETGQADLRELQAGEFGDLAGGERGVLLQGQGHILPQRERAPQRAALVEHAEGLEQAAARGEIGGGERPAGELHLARHRRMQADQMAEQRALAATAAADDEEDLAALDGEVDVLQHDAPVIAALQAGHRDGGRGGGGMGGGGVHGLTGRGCRKSRRKARWPR